MLPHLGEGLLPFVTSQRAARSTRGPTHSLTGSVGLSLQDVRIQDRQVLLGSGFPAPASVPILFEETFYNQQEQSYSILCISRPVEVDPSQTEAEPSPPLPPTPYCLKSLEDVREFLGRHAHKLDKFIQVFCQSFKEQERKGLRHHIVGPLTILKSFASQIKVCRLELIVCLLAGLCEQPLHKVSSVSAEGLASGEWNGTADTHTHTHTLIISWLCFLFDFASAETSGQAGAADDSAQTGCGGKIKTCDTTCS